MDPAVQRMLGYAWAAPNSFLGLLVAAIARLAGGTWRRERGVLEVHGPLLSWLLRRSSLLHGGVAALALGHVVLGRDHCCLDRCRDHERVHVRQAERWGPLFLPVYFGASLWAWARGGHFYRDNFLEREAYRVAPVRFAVADGRSRE